MIHFLFLQMSHNAHSKPLGRVPFPTDYIVGIVRRNRRSSFCMHGQSTCIPDLFRIMIGSIAVYGHPHVKWLLEGNIILKTKWTFSSFSCLHPMAQRSFISASTKPLIWEMSPAGGKEGWFGGVSDISLECKLTEQFRVLLSRCS